MHEMRLNRSHLVTLDSVVQALTADDKMISDNVKRARFLATGTILTDASMASIEAVYQNSGAAESLKLDIASPMGKDMYLAHQALDRFEVATSDVAWTAWVKDGNISPDIDFALRIQCNGLCFEAHYDTRFKALDSVVELAYIAIVNPDTLYNRENLIFVKQPKTGMFLVKAPGRPMVVAMLSSDGEPVSLEWDEHFDADSYRIFDATDSSYRFITGDTADDAVIIPKTISMNDSRFVVFETAQLLRNLSSLIHNSTLLTI